MTRTQNFRGWAFTPTGGITLLGPLIIALALLLLPGCAALKVATGSVKQPVTQEQVFALESGYAAVQIGLAAYRSLPYCETDPAPCQKAPVALQIKKADASATLALSALETFVKNNDTINIPAAYQAAIAATNAVKQIMAIYNVGSAA